MKNSCKNLIALVFPLIINVTIMNSQTRPVPADFFDTFSDIGSPAIKGKYVYNEKDQSISISGSGSNIWFNHDSFSFLYRKMKGDFILQTTIRFLGDGHELHRKTGIMIRSSGNPGSAVVACTIHGDGLTSLQYRTYEADSMKEIKMDITGPDILQLEKKGNSFIMSVAHSGELYLVSRLDNLDLGEDLLSGLFVCSHNDSFTEEVEFSNTRVYNTAPDDLVQYKDYLGSLLEVLNIETGKRTILAGYEGSWQAPNWTPDGKTLIYNSEGKLYTFDLESRKSAVLNTGFADNNNNDHVLSFDGKYLGISHHPEETGGQSVIYTVPSGGGIPEKVTDKSPSYLHGWSPDNQFLVYTAERNGDYNIYRIPVKGGEEVQLTSAPGLDDGPEYSPDGKYIYFCSTRTGRMQVWRMDPDGSNQVQLTFDDLNNWFPHISPDNRWIVFVSFPASVQADKHPFYERVSIRRIPVDGGKPEVLAHLYGGQGTMNVPSWSPDSKNISFVSNGLFPF